jgi:hypothetical protein
MVLWTHLNVTLYEYCLYCWYSYHHIPCPTIRPYSLPKQDLQIMRVGSSEFFVLNPSRRMCTFICLFSTYALQPFKAYCAIWVRRSNFRHQASPRVSPRECTQRRKVELWARNIREFCLNADLHVTFRNLLHAIKLRHGTDGFTSPPKEVVLRIFSP